MAYREVFLAKQTRLNQLILPELERRDMSVNQLALRADTSVNSILRGITRLGNPTTLTLIAEALDLPPQVVHRAAVLDAGYLI